MSWGLYQEHNWPLFGEVSKNNNMDYNIYRCPEPTAVKTGEPWFPRTNFCPCDPILSNISGRGYVACNFGISKKKPNGPAHNLSSQDTIPNEKQVVGSLFNGRQTVPPQTNPDPLIRIGQSWRTVY
jgi:hypothetical protein